MNYNTRGLRREMAKLLDKSDAWVVIRTDRQGLHVHTPDSGHLILLADFLASQPELLNIINRHAEGIENACPADQCECAHYGIHRN